MKGGKTDPLVIPELEKEAATYRRRNVPWTEEEKQIGHRYYGRVPWKCLSKYLPGRTEQSTRCMVDRTK
jgi:hypothetical protein